MLHTQTVAPQTLGLLKQLEAEPRLAAFNLAGGTALALYLGHRVSVDRSTPGNSKRFFRSDTDSKRPSGAPTR